MPASGTPSKIFEGEHQVADAERHLGILFFDALQDRFARIGLQLIQQVGGAFESRHRRGGSVRPATPGVCAGRARPSAATSGENWRNCASRLMVSARTSSGRRISSGGGLARIQVGQDEGNRLRMLAFEKFGQLLRIGLLQAFQVHDAHLHRFRDLVEQLSGAGFPKRFDQQLLRIFRPTFGQVTLGENELVVLLEHGDRGLGFHVFQLGDALREALHVRLGEVAVDVAGRFFPEQHHEDGGFLEARVGSIGGH